MGTHPIFESDFDCLTEMEVTQKSPLATLAPLKGLRSILSFFPHSSRLSDTVVPYGLAVADGSRVKISCRNCPSKAECQECGVCGCVVCAACYFPDYSRADTRFKCRACYSI